MASPIDSQSTLVGLFTTRTDAERAIRDLKSAGFTEDQIGVAMKNREEQQELIEETGSSAAEGAATGAVSGGVVGGLMGLLGSLLIPGVGPIVVGGVLASTLTGAGIGAATGGLIGALVGLGVPEEDARHFDTGIRTGGVLITVAGGSRTGEAIGILQRHGADLGPSGVGRYGQFASSEASIAGADAGQQQIDLGEQTSRRDRYQGQERRRRREPSYTGPERRLATV